MNRRDFVRGLVGFGAVSAAGMAVLGQDIPTKEDWEKRFAELGAKIPSDEFVDGVYLGLPDATMTKFKPKLNADEWRSAILWTSLYEIGGGEPGDFGAFGQTCWYCSVTVPANAVSDLNAVDRIISDRVDQAKAMMVEEIRRAMVDRQAVIVEDISDLNGPPRYVPIRRFRLYGYPGAYLNGGFNDWDAIMSRRSSCPLAISPAVMPPLPKLPELPKWR